MSAKNNGLKTMTKRNKTSLNLCTSKIAKIVDFTGKTSIFKTFYIIPYIPSDYYMDTIYVNICLQIHDYSLPSANRLTPGNMIQ